SRKWLLLELPCPRSSVLSGKGRACRAPTKSRPVRRVSVGSESEHEIHHPHVLRRPQGRRAVVTSPRQGRLLRREIEGKRTPGATLLRPNRGGMLCVENNCPPIVHPCSVAAS